MTLTTTMMMMMMMMTMMMTTMSSLCSTLHTRIANQMGEDSRYREGIVHSPVRCSRNRSVRRESPKALFEAIEAAQAAVRLLFAERQLF